MDSRERIDHLYQYIVGSLQAGMLKWEDLATGEAVSRVTQIIARDARVVIPRILREAGTQLGSMVVGKLATVFKRKSGA